MWVWVSRFLRPKRHTSWLAILLPGIMSDSRLHKAQIVEAHKNLHRGRRRRPGQQGSRGAREPMNGRQQWPGQRDSSPMQMYHGNHGGMQPPFYGAGYGGMQSQSPYQPLTPRPSWNGLPDSSSPPLPQSGIFGPYEFKRWITDLHLRYSPANPMEPLVDPMLPDDPQTKCCVIM